MRIAQCSNPADGKSFVGRYNGERYTIDPGREALVPYDALCLWAGDPNSKDHDERRRFRTGEGRRLRTRYGAYEDDARFEQNKPTIQFFNQETGERIWTVLDDPEGIHGGTNVEAQSTQEAILNAKIASLEAKIDGINRMVEAGQLVVNPDAAPAETDAPAADAVGDLVPDEPAAVEAEGQPEAPPEDEPTKVRVGGRRAAAVG